MLHTDDDDEEDAVNTSGLKRKVMSDADFLAARELYELGKASIADLANDYDISRQALSKRFKDSKAVKGSRAHEVASATGAAVIATVERFAEKRAEMIEETRMAGLKALKQARMLTQKIVIDAAKAMKSMSTIDDDLRAMSRYNKILIDNTVASLQILRSDDHIDEEDLPTLSIEDLTDEDVLAHHIGTGALDEDATVADLNLYEFKIK